MNDSLDLAKTVTDRVDTILRIVSTYYGLRKEQLFVKTKLSDFVLPRHMAMYMLSRHTSMLTVQIARLFNCAYRSAHYGIERILTGIQYDEKIRRDAIAIDNLLKENILDFTQDG